MEGTFRIFIFYDTANMITLTLYDQNFWYVKKKIQKLKLFQNFSFRKADLDSGSLTKRSIYP